MIKLIYQNTYLIAVSLFVTTLYILINGYDFNTGDQAEHLPQVYQLFDSSLYPKDFFLQLYNKTFTVRHYWVCFVYILSFVFGVKLSCLLLYFLCMYITVFAWAKIAHLFLNNQGKTNYNKLIIFIALILIFIVCNPYTLGGNTLLGKIFIGSTVAEMFASLGIYFFLTKKRISAAIFLAFSLWFQALVGLQLFMVLAGILFFTSDFKNPKKSIVDLIVFSTVFIVCALPLLIPLLYAQKINNMGLISEHFYTLLYYKRAPWHYIPQDFSTKEYVAFMGIFIVAMFAFLKLKASKLKQQLLWFFVLVLLVCVFYFIAFQTKHFLWIGKLQWFKTTLWINAFCSVFIASLAINFITKIKIKNANMVFFLASVLCLSFMFYTDLFTSSTKYSFISNNPKTDLQKLHYYIKENTPKSAVFLIAIDNESFACEAQRSSVTSFKAVVHEPYFFEAWQKALEQFYKVDFNSNTFTKIQAINNYYTNYDTSQFVFYDYRIDNLKESKIIHLLSNKIHVEGDWVLSKVK